MIVIGFESANSLSLGDMLTHLIDGKLPRDVAIPVWTMRLPHTEAISGSDAANNRITYL